MFTLVDVSWGGFCVSSSKSSVSRVSKEGAGLFIDGFSVGGLDSFWGALLLFFMKENPFFAGASWGFDVTVGWDWDKFEVCDEGWGCFFLTNENDI